MGYLFQINGARVSNRHDGRFIQLRELQKLASEAALPLRSKLRKRELAKALNRHYAAVRILVSTRARQQRLDPITLDRPEAPLYWHRHDNGRCTVYGARALVEYLLQSTEFREPTSNLPFTDADLAKVDAAAASLGLPSVRARQRSKAPERERRNREAALIADQEAQNTVQTLCEYLEQLDAARDAQVTSLLATQLRFLVLPSLMHAVDEVLTYDRALGVQAMRSYCATLQRLTLNNAYARDVRNAVVEHYAALASLEAGD